MQAEAHGRVDPTFYDLGISMAQDILRGSGNAEHREYASSTLGAFKDSKKQAIDLLCEKGSVAHRRPQPTGKIHRSLKNKEN